MEREEREEAIDIIQSILDKYEEDECLVTDIGIGDEDVKAFKMAIETMRKYQKICKILDKSDNGEKCMYDTIEDIEEVRDGNVD